MFRGLITALVTPFTDGEFDARAFEKILAFQIENGSHGIVPCGTTGESPTLDEDEIRTIFDMSVAAVKGRKIPVIAGTGSNSTRKSVAMTEMAKQCGADAALIVVPYYNKPTQDGMYAHFKAIHDAVEIPIVLYNVPGRTGAEMSVDTVCRLAELPRIVALKDATSDMSRTTAIKSRVKGGFSILSGEDALAGACLAQGGDGCISVTSNIAPQECADFQNAWAAGDIQKFQALQARLMPLHKALFVETSPSPVKYAASKLGLCSDEVRLPLVSASPAARSAVDRAFAESGLIMERDSATLRRHG
ncbi:MAG TPA: 4-hydroxy-tetrahydrodipicolinate synthase [Alphaproteobacteria bacterium]|nr:4-hydroxy-tetrahydrodipicolinate synthase [Alphaproteobacteria bacterium]HNS44149.1 4-hydroxy-tetrahydrodipicolinate synthase [Alphaproteobacteria bacterium]